MFGEWQSSEEGQYYNANWQPYPSYVGGLEQGDQSEIATQNHAERVQAWRYYMDLMKNKRCGCSNDLGTFNITEYSMYSYANKDNFEYCDTPHVQKEACSAAIVSIEKSQGNQFPLIRIAQQKLHLPTSPLVVARCKIGLP